jgi:hypothetical protein
VAPINGTCNITVLGSVHAMQRKAGSANITWQYNRSFAIPGLYHYNVTCANPENVAVTNRDNATINDSDGPVITVLSPANNIIYHFLGTLNFTYNVTDYSNVGSCELRIDNETAETDTGVVEGITMTFSSDVYERGWHDWTVRCNDSTPLENSATSARRAFFMAYPSFNLTWTEIPVKVYRNEAGRRFILSVRNNGTDNATNANVSMDLPYGWSFSAGNASSYLINLTVGSALNLTWHVDINLTATLGMQNVTMNASDPSGAWNTLTTAVPVGSKDVEISAILTPGNLSCGFSENVTISATVHNPGENTTGFDVLFFVDGVLVNSTLAPFMDTDDEYNVSYTWQPGNESVYNITVQTNLSSDTYHPNDALSVRYRKYNVDTSLDYSWTSLSSDRYNVTLTLTNNKNCTLTTATSIDYLVPAGFNASSFTPAANQTITTAAPYAGRASRWQYIIAPFGHHTAHAVINGTNATYYTSRLVMGASG